MLERGVFTPPGCAVGNNTIRELGQSIRAMAPTAVCFHLGDLVSVCGLTVIEDLCKMPYSTVWFELTWQGSKGSVEVGMLASQGELGFEAFVLLRNHGHWTLMAHLKGSHLADQEMQEMSLAAPGESPPGGVKLSMYALRAAMGFLSALHCSNVARREHIPDAKLQRARSKRGKQPLFSYWTLELAGAGARGENLGGTHASPRVHLRRGHPRQHAPGKWTWVQPHAVGNRSLGIVHKDYQAAPTLQAAP